MKGVMPEPYTRGAILVCLDILDGLVVKGVGFTDLRTMGNPVELAERAASAGADEIVLLSIGGGSGEDAFLNTIKEVAGAVSVPLLVGGGLGSVAGMERALEAGASRVSVNSAAVREPDLVAEAAHHLGSEWVVVSIDAAKVPATGAFQAYVAGGKTATNLDAVAWARQMEGAGAGALLLTSIGKDGARTGFDLELTGAVAAAVDVPVIASGGAGNAAHFVDVFTLTGAKAALGAGIFHDGTITPAAVKQELERAGLYPVKEGVTP